MQNEKEKKREIFQKKKNKRRQKLIHSVEVTLEIFLD